MLSTVSKFDTIQFDMHVFRGQSIWTVTPDSGDEWDSKDSYC